MTEKIKYCIRRAEELVKTQKLIYICAYQQALDEWSRGALLIEFEED